MKILCHDKVVRFFATPPDCPYLCLMCGGYVAPYRRYAEEHICETAIPNQEVIDRYRRTGKIKLERTK